MTAACYKTDKDAPQPGCRCTMCCRAREEDIPIRIRALMYERERDFANIGIAAPVIRHATSAYISGAMGLAEMQIELIAALATLCDKQCKDLMAALAIKPFVMSP